MPVDISRAVSAIGAERFALLAGPAAGYEGSGVAGRAAATSALGALADELRAADATLVGARTADLKAAILRESAGVSVSGRTVERDEACARTIARGLDGRWVADADSGSLSRAEVSMLASMPKRVQRRLKDAADVSGLGRREMSDLVRRAYLLHLGGGRDGGGLELAVEALENAARSKAPVPGALVARAAAAIAAIGGNVHGKGE